MRKILTTVYFSGAILFGTCIAQETQTPGKALPELRETIRRQLNEMNNVINNEYATYENRKRKLGELALTLEEFHEIDDKSFEELKDKIEEELVNISSDLKNYKNMFFEENRIDFFKYAKSVPSVFDAQDENVELFRQLQSVVENIIKKGYFDRQEVGEMLKPEASLCSLGLMNCLDHYTLFLASKFFQSIDDHKNFVMSSRRLLGNMEKFHYNPIALDKTTREFFPKIETLHLYSEDDEKFDGDERIERREVWYPYDLTKERAENTTYHNLTLTREFITKKFADRTEILMNDWDEVIDTSEITDGLALGDYAFAGLNRLRKIELPTFITRLGDYCLVGCHRLLEIKLPNRLKVVGENCFENAYALTEVVIPETCTKIGPYCFSNCKDLRYVNLPNILGMLPQRCFSDCSSLNEIFIPENILEIQDSCFYGCGLTSIELPKGPTRLGESAFRSCLNLKQLVLPTTLKTIGWRCFEGCIGLTKLRIPKSVQQVDFPFYGCSKLTVINESPLLLYAKDLGAEKVENIGLPKLNGLDTKQLIRMQKAESALDKLPHLDLLTKPHRINELKQLATLVVLTDRYNVNNNTADQINGIERTLSTLAQLSSLSSLSWLPGYNEFSKLSELSSLSNLK